jgi:hypothetical protein
MQMAEKIYSGILVISKCDKRNSGISVILKLISGIPVINETNSGISVICRSLY